MPLGNIIQGSHKMQMKSTYNVFVLFGKKIKIHFCH